jgi:hypothetical protein
MRFTRVTSFAVVAVLLAGGCRKKEAVKFGEMGPSSWVVDGAAYRVASSHFEQAASGAITYVMRYPVPQGTADTAIDKDGAGILVWPLLKYAYNNRTFHRMPQPPHGGSGPPQTMAVDVLSADGKRVLFRHEAPVGK